MANKAGNTINSTLAITGIYQDLMTPGLTETNKMLKEFGKIIGEANKKIQENTETSKTNAKTTADTTKTVTEATKAASNFGIVMGASGKIAAQAYSTFEKGAKTAFGDVLGTLYAVSKVVAITTFAFRMLGDALSPKSVMKAYVSTLGNILGGLKSIGIESKALNRAYLGSAFALNELTKKGNKGAASFGQLARTIFGYYTGIGVSTKKTKEATTTLGKLNEQVANSTRQYGTVAGAMAGLVGKGHGLISFFGSMSLAIPIIGAVTGAIALVFNTISGFAQKSIDAGSAIEDNAAKVGLSTQAYQTWDIVLKQAGTTISDITPSMNELRNSMMLAGKETSLESSIFKQLGISVMDSTGKFKDTDTVFKETIISLSKIGDATARNIAANKLFGKSSKELAPLLAMNTDEIESMLGEYSKYTAMSPELINVTAKIGDQQDLMGAKFTHFKNIILTPFIKMFGIMTESFANVNYIKAFAGVWGSVQAALFGVTYLVTNLITLVGVLTQSIVVAAETINTAFGVMAKGLSMVPGLPTEWKAFLEGYYTESVSDLKKEVLGLGGALQVSAASLSGGAYTGDIFAQGADKSKKGAMDLSQGGGDGGAAKKRMDDLNKALAISDAARDATLQKTYEGRLKMLANQHYKEKTELIKNNVSTVSIDIKYAADKAAILKEQFDAEKALIDEANRQKKEAMDAAMAVSEMSRTAILQKSMAGRVRLLTEEYDKNFVILMKQGLSTKNLDQKYADDRAALKKAEQDEILRIQEETMAKERDMAATKLMLAESSINRGRDVRVKAISLLDIEQQKEADSFKLMLDQKKISFEEYQNQITEIELDFALRRSEMTAQYDAEDKQARFDNFQSWSSSISQVTQEALSLNEQVYQYMKAKNDASYENWYDTEKAKIDTLNVTSKRKSQLEAKLEKEAEQKRKEAGEKQKKWAIVSALINGALGVTAALATTPTVPLGIIMAAFVAASTVASVAAISSQAFATGGKVKNTSGSVFGDKEIIRANPGERVLTAMENENYEKSRGTTQFGNISSSVVINGNADGSTVDQIATNNRKFMENLKSGIETLVSSGKMPSFA